MQPLASIPECARVKRCCRLNGEGNMVMTVRAARLRSTRRESGAYLSEFPVAIWLLFMGLFFPLLMLAIITFRANFLNLVAKEAAHAASKAQTFQDGTVDKPQAIELAKTTANQAASRFSGLAINNIKTMIVITDVTTQNITKQETK